MDIETKSPAMVEFLDKVTKDMFGQTRTEAKSGNTCVSCGKPATKFVDKLSEKEYSISGLCQICQNQIFG